MIADGLISQDELAGLFGNEMPWAAVELLCSKKPIEEIRSGLQGISATWVKRTPLEILVGKLKLLSTTTPVAKEAIVCLEAMGALLQEVDVYLTLLGVPAEGNQTPYERMQAAVKSHHATLMATMVGCSGNTITIDCNDLDIRDGLMRLFSGELPEAIPTAPVEPEETECPECGGTGDPPGRTESIADALR